MFTAQQLTPTIRTSMARRGNYGFEKRQKEIKKQQKQTAKLEKKQQKKDGAAAETVVAENEGADEQKTD